MSNISSIIKRSFSFLSSGKKTATNDEPAASAESDSPDVQPDITMPDNTGDPLEIAARPNRWRRVVARIKNVLTLKRSTEAESIPDESAESDSAAGLSPDDGQGGPAAARRERENSAARADGGSTDEEPVESEFKLNFWQRAVMALKKAIRRNPKAEPDQPETETRDLRSRDRTSSEDEPEEEEAPPSAFRRLLGKSALIALLVLSIGLASAVAYIVIDKANKKHEEEAALALEKRNKALEAEYKKLQEKAKALQAENTKLHSPAQPGAGSATVDSASSASPSVGTGNSGDAMDCAVVSNKATAGEALKRCIEAYNAVNGR